VPGQWNLPNSSRLAVDNPRGIPSRASAAVDSIRDLASWEEPSRARIVSKIATCLDQIVVAIRDHF